MKIIYNTSDHSLDEEMNDENINNNYIYMYMLNVSMK